MSRLAQNRQIAIDISFCPWTLHLVLDCAKRQVGKVNLMNHRLHAFMQLSMLGLRIQPGESLLTLYAEIYQIVEG